MRKHELHHAEKTIAVYPGSFDPITNGHFDIIERAAFLFDEVHVLVAQSSSKKPMFPTAQRVEMVAESCEELVEGGHVVVSSLPTGKATVDYATQLGARAMLRGLRTVTDFDAEFALAIANMGLAEHIETMFLIPQPENHFISSSRVREIFHLRGHESVKDLVPEAVYTALQLRKLS